MTYSEWQILQRFHGYMDSHGMGTGWAWGLRSVINPHGLMGILWIFSNSCEIQWKHGVNVIIHVRISPNSPILNLF